MSSYAEIKARCIEEAKLFEDLDFPATPSSILPDSSYPEDWLWKRPKEIKNNAKFILDGASRFDLIQGELGDCWFIAAAAVLATKRDLFYNVVPRNQSFDTDYAGIFEFHFWRFGKWVDVVIDDRLPVTSDGELKFCQNRSSPNEFWAALLEKAYAKLFGSYQHLHSGLVRDALVDFTGGLAEAYNFKKKDELPPDLFDIARKSFHLGSLLGTGIFNDVGYTTEEKLWNGLYKGHAYSITHIIEARIQGWHIKLVRLRNPWGAGEWNQAWSDQSDEWKSVSEEEKKKLGLVVDDDGEFWMSWDDFLDNTSTLDIVHLGPEAFARLGFPEEFIQWHETVYHGRWVKGVNAGGSGIIKSNKEMYYTNPQYFFTLEVPDVDDVSQECTCIVSLMQKDIRRRRMDPNRKSLFVGFDIYKMKTDSTVPLSSDKFLEHSKLKKQYQTRTPLREQTSRLQLDPGHYCVIVDTLVGGKEGEFLLRIYTYSKVTSREYKEETGPIENNVSKPVGNLSADLFWKSAGEDHVVDARDLRDLLNELSRSEFGETTTFSVEACRTLISMVDTDRTGTLNFEEMGQLWDEVVLWRKTFDRFDRDKTGCIEVHELKRMFTILGFNLGFETLATLAIRFGGKDRTLFFEDFVLCMSKTLAMYTAFKVFSSDTNEAKLNLDQWMTTTLHY